MNTNEQSGNWFAANGANVVRRLLVARDGLGSSAAHIKGERIGVLMVSVAKRIATFPSVPCAAQFGPANGAECQNLTGQQLGIFVTAAVKRWAGVFKSSGARPDLRGVVR